MGVLLIWVILPIAGVYLCLYLFGVRRSYCVGATVIVAIAYTAILAVKANDIVGWAYRQHDKKYGTGGPWPPPEAAKNENMPPRMVPLPGQQNVDTHNSERPPPPPPSK